MTLQTGEETTWRSRMGRVHPNQHATLWTDGSAHKNVTHVLTLVCPTSWAHCEEQGGLWTFPHASWQANHTNTHSYRNTPTCVTHYPGLAYNTCTYMYHVHSLWKSPSVWVHVLTGDRLLVKCMLCIHVYMYVVGLVVVIVMWLSCDCNKPIREVGMWYVV